MFDLILISIIDKTTCQPFQNMRALLNVAQQPTTTVRTEFATIEFTQHRMTTQAVKFDLTCINLCLHTAVFLSAVTVCSPQCYAMENSLLLSPR